MRSSHVTLLCNIKKLVTIILHWKQATQCDNLLSQPFVGWYKCTKILHYISEITTSFSFSKSLSVPKFHWIYVMILITRNCFFKFIKLEEHVVPSNTLPHDILFHDIQLSSWMLNFQSCTVYRDYANFTLRYLPLQ